MLLDLIVLYCLFTLEGILIRVQGVVFLSYVLDQVLCLCVLPLY
jgi:hypothetical protein